MGRRSNNHAVDEICRQWGRVRREVRGLEDAKLARDQVGALRSTLGQQRDLHSGAKTNFADQNWPEVYEGDAAVVNQAFHAMRPAMKVVMDVHYATRATVEMRAQFLCMSRETYLRRVNDARAFVEGWIARVETVSKIKDVFDQKNRRISLA
jgi:hypothetical protein